jgi:hypothetical protein
MNTEEPKKYTELIPSPFQQIDTNHSDVGHEGLLHDLQELVKEADQYSFHDYKNKKYPVPKMALIKKLEEIMNRVKQGYYDNKNIV